MNTKTFKPNFNKETKTHNFKTVLDNEVKQTMVKQNIANNPRYKK